MKSFAFLLLSISIIFSCKSQVVQKQNLDFEEYYSYQNLPYKWSAQGDYEVRTDSIFKQSGKYSILIASKKLDTTLSEIIYYNIPANYEGETIKLEGYIKTEDIEGGYCGLFLSVKTKDTVPVYELMRDKKISGTNEWTKYSISASYPKDAKDILVGGYLTGQGMVWFDNLKLTLDGKDVQTLKEIEKPVPKATLDKAFDNGTGIEIDNLNDNDISNLDLLGKVWGFLKYHHPIVCQGNYNWDYELFRILPNYLNARTKEERDQSITNWINKFGKIEHCKTCEETSPDAFLKPDSSWVEDYQLSPELKTKLKFIYQNRCQGEQFYVAKGIADNAIFQNEQYYAFLSYPDDGFRLLALYRYWNMVQYFFPYKYLTDKDWNGVLREYIPKFMGAKNKLEYELAMVQIIGDIKDTHAQLVTQGTKLDRSRGNYYAPFRIEYIEDQWVVTDYYNPDFVDTAKIKIGDIITQIEGKAIAKLVDSISPFYPASNDAVRFRYISMDLLRSNKEIIKIETLSNGTNNQLEIPLYPRNSLDMEWYNDNQEKSYRFLKDDIGYISLKKVVQPDINSIKRLFARTKGIIIDIRRYPNGAAASLWPYFIKSGTPVSKFTYPNISNPGEFLFTPLRRVEKSTDPNYTGKLVILINDGTQSMAEFTAMGYRANPSTTIIGSTTAGADGNVSDILLPGGLQTRFSGIGVYYPDGSETQRIGIVPDVIVKPTIDGIKSGRDELLEKAIELINISN